MIEVLVNALYYLIEFYIISTATNKCTCFAFFVRMAAQNFVVIAKIRLFTCNYLLMCVCVRARVCAWTCKHRCMPKLVWSNLAARRYELSTINEEFTIIV